MKRLKRSDGTIDAKDMWDAVCHLTGQKQEYLQLSGFNADSFNEHYANISTDSVYSAPSYKLTASSSAEYITEWHLIAIDPLLLAWIYCRHGF